MNTNYCRVCGLYHVDKPYGDDGECPTHEICSCCNVEFGYEDYTIKSTLKFRKKWFEDGANWSNKKTKPEDWKLEEQLKNIPQDFL